MEKGKGTYGRDRITIYLIAAIVAVAGAEWLAVVIVLADVGGEPVAQLLAKAFRKIGVQ